MAIHQRALDTVEIAAWWEMRAGPARHFSARTPEHSKTRGKVWNRVRFEAATVSQKPASVFMVVLW